MQNSLEITIRKKVLIVFQKRRKKRPDEPDDIAEVYHTQTSSVATVPPPQLDNEEWAANHFSSLSTISQQPPSASTSNSALHSAFASNNWHENILNQINTSSTGAPSLPTPHSAPLHSSFIDPTPLTDPSSIGQSNATPASIPESTGSGSGLSPNTFQRVKKRRQHSPDATRRIVAANFSNEIDALEILANAAAEGDSEEEQKPANEEQKKTLRWDLSEDHTQSQRIEEYCLIKAGVLSVNDLENLVRLFFEHYHPVLVSSQSLIRS